MILRLFIKYICISIVNTFLEKFLNKVVGLMYVKSQKHNLLNGFEQCIDGI